MRPAYSILWYTRNLRNWFLHLLCYIKGLKLKVHCESTPKVLCESHIDVHYNVSSSQRNKLICVVPVYYCWRFCLYLVLHVQLCTICVQLCIFVYCMYNRMHWKYGTVHIHSKYQGFFYFKHMNNKLKKVWNVTLDFNVISRIDIFRK